MQPQEEDDGDPNNNVLWNKVAINAKFKTMGQTMKVFGPEKAQDKKIVVATSNMAVTAELLWGFKEDAWESHVDYGQQGSKTRNLYITGGAVERGVNMSLMTRQPQSNSSTDPDDVVQFIQVSRESLQ